MATKTRPLTNIVAMSEDGNVDLLGYVVWYSLPDRGVPLANIEYEWKINKLPDTILPEEPRPYYRFKRAMRSLEGKESHQRLTRETDVKLLQDDHDFCIYHVSRVERDFEDKVINYPKAMRATFIKADANAGQKRPYIFEPLDEVPVDDVLPMMQAAQKYYDGPSLLIEGAKVRAMVRNYLRDVPDKAREIPALAGIGLRGRAGGLYFVAEQHKATLNHLSKALHGIYGGDAQLVALPLADAGDNSELVRRAHVESVVEDAQEAMQAVVELKEKSGATRADVIQHHWNKLHGLREIAEERHKLLRGKSREVETALDLLKAQLEGLV